MTATLIAIVIAIATVTGLCYFRANGWAWVASIAALLIGAMVLLPGERSILLWVITWLIFSAIAVVLNHTPIRRRFLSDPLFVWYKKLLPAVSQTEQEALEAGTVWWDGELFTGKPDWKKLLAYPKPMLSAEEQAFLDGPTEQLCAMVDDWKITHELYDLPPEIWRFIGEKGFLGMIIPKHYGGLEFSARAHSEVVMKLSSRSSATAVTVMVPNSLGPAELLMHYGTEQQKNHYLPRLAKGLEIPCFALTGPDAGSDAGSIPDFGIVCRQEWEGEKDVLGIRLTWEKRYITLGPVATLLGLAFKLYDPDHLVSTNEDIGITLALIPTKTPGVNIGRRHLPLNGAFQNGPNSGKDIFIPMEWVIGGQPRIGQGWRMLMECLAAGRSISLPAQSIAAAKLCARATGAYSRIRQQFSTPIGKFEGVEEALARIGGNAYMMDAARVMTAGAVDLGEKPSVPSAIVKYHMTERMRSVINDAMDIHGGKGICLGPNNYLGRAYQLVPVAITVEGANILTRSMIIFGQGAIRGHPYVLRELETSRMSDAEQAAEQFDGLLWEHVSFSAMNAARSLVLGISGGRGTTVPGAREVQRYYQQMNRFAAAFALLADIAMMVMGGELKRKEKLSARLGDVLSNLYLSSAALKRYEDDGQHQADLPFLLWSLHDAFFKLQIAMDGILANFPNRPLAWILRRLVFPKGLTLEAPSDAMGHKVAKLMLEPSEARDRLTRGIYSPRREDDAVGCLEIALDAAIAAEAVQAKLRAGKKSGLIDGRTADDLTERALEKGVITVADMEILRRAKQLTRKVIMVDDFPQDFGRATQHRQEPERLGALM
jgi:acyl-CoA dehydrogenase